MLVNLSPGVLAGGDHDGTGSHLGGRLAQAGTEVHLIDHGAHLLAVREHGLRVVWTCRLWAAPVLRTSAATGTPRARVPPRVRSLVADRFRIRSRRPDKAARRGRRWRSCRW